MLHPFLYASLSNSLFYVPSSPLFLALIIFLYWYAFFKKSPPSNLGLITPHETPKMCIHTGYVFNCSHAASLREAPRLFLSEPCASYKIQADSCRVKHTQEIILPVYCRKCGGPKDPKFRGYPVISGLFLEWHISHRPEKVSFREINWATV